MIGLSNANFNPPPQTQASGLGSGQAVSPGLYDLSINAFNIQTFGGTLAYPLDVGKYIWTVTFSEYTRTNLNSVGTFQPSLYPGIIMPLPQQLLNLDSVDWHEEEIGTLPGTFINGLASVIQGQGFGTNQQTAGAAGAMAVNAGLAGTAGVATLSPTGVSSGFEALYGFSPNQFVVMLMRGPKYKRHTFTWELSPTNAKEADILRQIIKTFKNAMAPNVYGAFGGAPILFTFPKILYIRLYPNSKFMYKFKPCVCDHFSVNYSPGNRAAFNVNKSGTIGDNAPSNVQLNMHLIELEYWIEGNVTDSNDPDDVYTQAPNNSTLSQTVTAITNSDQITNTVTNQVQQTFGG